MDFGTLLHTAQKNEKTGKKEGIRCYNTKFEPPKKEQRNRQLSNNIKKFLAKKEAEEKERKQEANKRKEELLALRAKDKKATRRVNVMLKRTKSANQSVLQDAIDQDNTSVTLAGPIQPDEDDYGYVSQEAAAFYSKMMEKYSKIPDEPKFTLNKKKVSTDLNTTRERVKAALEREREEALMPHRRKRKHKEESGPVMESFEELKKEEESKQKIRTPAPPPINFNDLLKLAEKKQFEPIVIEQKPKDEERPLTKKQKKEMEREKEWRDRKEGKLPPLEKTVSQNRIPKLNTDKTNTERKKTVITGVSKKEPLVQQKTQPTAQPLKKINTNKSPIPSNEKKVAQSVISVSARTSKPGSLLKNTLMRTKEPATVMKRDEVLKSRPEAIEAKTGEPKLYSKAHLKDMKEKQLSSLQLPSPNLKRKDFPSSDVKRKPGANKRRILDDEDEYDSEMDDFIDDGPEELPNYSKYISEIFGYDKSKYRDVDDDVDNMESTFAQQMREEVISTKIGIMEDLEDIRKEEEEKRRKALIKKKYK